MKIIIKTTNFNLTEDLRNYIEKKIGSLEKYIQVSPKGKIFEIKAHVEIKKTTRHHQTGPFLKAKCQIFLPKKSLRAESQQKDIRLATDEIRKELKREIKRYKGGFKSLMKRRARNIKRFLHLSHLARFWRKGRIREKER